MSDPDKSEQLVLAGPGEITIQEMKDNFVKGSIHPEMPAFLIYEGKSILACDMMRRLLAAVGGLKKRHAAKRVTVDRERFISLLMDVFTLIRSLCHEEVTIRSDVPVRSMEVAWDVSAKELAGHTNPQSYIDMMTDRTVQAMFMELLAKHTRLIERDHVAMNRKQFCLRAYVGTQNDIA